MEARTFVESYARAFSKNPKRATWLGICLFAYPQSCSDGDESFEGWFAKQSAPPEQVTFYQVGQNASHDFYLGYDKDNRVYKASAGHECLDPYWTVVEGDDFGYMGHY